jgi:hypothetical protein
MIACAPHAMINLMIPKKFIGENEGTERRSPKLQFKCWQICPSQLPHRVITA